MNDILELVATIIVGVTAFTIIYRLAPFKEWENIKPKISFFPKYVAKFDKPLGEIESSLEAIKFNKIDSSTFTRGKVYGDFSAKAIKLTVKVDDGSNEIRVYASVFGVLFDTGDLWQVTSDIING